MDQRTPLRDEAANALRMARAFARMDQEEFAASLAALTSRPVNRAMVSNWERGIHEAGATILLAAVDISKVPLEVLRQRPDVKDLNRRLDDLSSD